MLSVVKTGAETAMEKKKIENYLFFFLLLTNLMLCLVLGKIWEINRKDIHNNEMEEMKECILKFSIRSHSLDLGTIRDRSLSSVIFYILIFFI